MTVIFFGCILEKFVLRKIDFFVAFETKINLLIHLLKKNSIIFKKKMPIFWLSIIMMY